MITPETITHLREVAQKATQGKWEAVEDTSGGHFHVRCRYSDSQLDYGHIIWVTPGSRNRQADLEYVAAANPQTILELLDENERLKKENVQLTAEGKRLFEELVWEFL